MNTYEFYAEEKWMRVIKKIATPPFFSFLTSHFYITYATFDNKLSSNLHIDMGGQRLSVFFIKRQ